MTISWPVAVVPVHSEFFLEHNTTIFQSPITRSQQVLRRQGERWRMSITLPPMLRPTAQTIDALLAKLRGAYGTIELWNFERPEPLGSNLDRGVIPDTFFSDGTGFTDDTGFSGGAAQVVVLGAHSMGDTEVTVDGFYQPAGYADPLLAGDYVGIGNRLYMLTEDAPVGDDWHVVLYIAPPLKADVEDEAVVTRTRPTASFRLTDDSQANRKVDGPLYTFSLDFVEAQQ